MPKPTNHSRSQSEQRPNSKSNRRLLRKLAFPLSLTVQNVRCFGEKAQTLDLSDGNGQPARWTLLLGNNGCGKTTLLEVFASICEGPRDVDETIAAAYGIGWAERRHWKPVRFGAKEARLRCTACVDWRFTAAGQRPSVVESKLQLGADGGGTGTLHLDAQYHCYGYGPTRRLGATTVTEYETSDPCASLFSDDANLRNAEELLLRLDYSASKESEIKPRQRAQLTRVKKTLCELLPDVSEIRINKPTEKAPTPNVEFKTPYGWVKLPGLGHGYRSLIAWVVDLASRLFEAHPNSENPLAEPVVVLVDEIDLHLHPTWQRRVMRHLTERFPNAQFIATAHSPLIAQAADEANVVLLQREGDHVVIRNHMQPMRGARLDQVVTSELYGLETARPPHLEEKLV